MLLIIDDIDNFYYIFKDGYVSSCPNKVFDLMIIIFEKSCILFFRLQFRQNHHPGIDNSVCDICMTGICFNSYCNAFLFALCLKFYFCKETKTSAFYILLQLSKTVKCWIYIRLKENQCLPYHLQTNAVRDFFKIVGDHPGTWVDYIDDVIFGVGTKKKKRKKKKQMTTKYSLWQGGLLTIQISQTVYGCCFYLSVCDKLLDNQTRYISIRIQASRRTTSTIAPP